MYQACKKVNCYEKVHAAVYLRVSSEKTTSGVPRGSNLGPVF